MFCFVSTLLSLRSVYGLVLRRLDSPFVKPDRGKTEWAELARSDGLMKACLVFLVTFYKQFCLFTL